MSILDLEYESGLAHHRLAEKYLRSAKIVYEATVKGDVVDFNTMLSEYEPLLFLSAHSMELNFKAYLIAYGIPIKDAEGIGHDLGKLARKCFAEGMQLPDWSKAPIDITNAIFRRSRAAQRNDYRARYPANPNTGPTELQFPNATLRTATVVSELGGAAAKQRFSIVLSRQGS